MKKYSFLKCSAEGYKGWNEILKHTFEEINKHIKEENIEGFEITYIKEKYGGLRFESNGGDEVILDILLDAENISYNICEECGRYGWSRDGGRIRTLCNECYKIYNTKSISDKKKKIYYSKIKSGEISSINLDEDKLFTEEDLLYINEVNNKYSYGDFQKQYSKYLQLKEGKKYSYQRFYELLQDYPFIDVLKIVHRKEKQYGNRRKGYNKYDDNFYIRIYNLYEYGHRCDMIKEILNLSVGLHCIYKYIKKGKEILNNKKEIGD